MKKQWISPNLEELNIMVGPVIFSQELTGYTPAGPS